MSEYQHFLNNPPQLKRNKNLKKHKTNGQKLLIAAAAGASIVASGETGSQTDDNKAADELLTPILHVSNEMTVSGVEFQMNTETTGQQKFSNITVLDDGGFVVTWYSGDDQDGDGYGIYGQRYNTDGSTYGSEFSVNSTTAGDQGDSHVSNLKDGSFVITWYSQDSSNDFQIMGQKYNADGTEWGDEFQINTNSVTSLKSPHIAGLEDGGFIVAWESSGQDGSVMGVYAQRYNADGSTNGSEFLVNTTTSGYQEDPAIVGFDDGSFLIVWESSGDLDGDGYGVFGQKYNADGSVNGGEFQINAYTDLNQYNAVITLLNDGSYVITWESDEQDGSDFGIYGQIYNADHSVKKSEFLINTFISDEQTDPAIAALSDGGFVVVWQSYGQDSQYYGILGQRFDAAGEPIDDEFLINSYGTESQYFTSVAATENGGFVVSWTSRGQDGDDYGIYAQRFEFSDTYKLTMDASGDFEIVNLLQSEQNSSGVAFGSVSISDVPDYVSFSQGSDDGNGTWTIEQDDLEGLQIITSNGEMGNFSLTLSVTLTNSSGDTETTSTAIDVSVAQVLTGNAVDNDFNLRSAQVGDFWYIDGLGGDDMLEIHSVGAPPYFEIQGNDLHFSTNGKDYLLHSIETLEHIGINDVADLHIFMSDVTEAEYDIWLANSYDYDF